MLLKEIAEEIEKKADLVKIASNYVALSESRRAVKGPCPFHTDHGNSFMVLPEKNIFKCFGCGKEGGVIEFVMQAEKMTHEASVNYLYERLLLRSN